MNRGFDEWEWDDEDPHWLFVSDAPQLSGESAVAVLELLWAIADEIDSKYVADIAGYRRGLHPEPDPRSAPWLRPIQEQQLSLDLGDDGYF